MIPEEGGDAPLSPPAQKLLPVPAQQRSIMHFSVRVQLRSAAKHAAWEGASCRWRRVGHERPPLRCLPLTAFSHVVPCHPILFPEKNPLN
jgi:hypothetical protein